MRRNTRVRYCALRGLEIPAHLLRNISNNRQVKVIMLLPETAETQQPSKPILKERLLDIAKRCAALPLLDPRTADEILGYDYHVMPRA